VASRPFLALSRRGNDILPIPSIVMVSCIRFLSGNLISKDVIRLLEECAKSV